MIYPRKQQCHDSCIHTAYQEPLKMEEIVLIAFTAICSFYHYPFRSYQANYQPVHNKQVYYIPCHGNNKNVYQ